ncbi:hypothetical protein JOD69_002957 [Methylocaldum sp. RMAD-M]|jgi:hypothetical protein|nr:hypothetical protein [Methylocaldum sp. RMAD-M]
MEVLNAKVTERNVYQRTREQAVKLVLGEGLLLREAGVRLF